jgi:dihydrolipoamide dehydrogenase
MQKFDYDVLVLGSGPGGYVAAIKASQLGLKVAIVEKANLGGVCLNWGCIPTKALLRTAEILDYIKNAEEFGITCKSYEVNFEKVIARSREIANKLSGGISHLLKKCDVSVINGHGKFINKNCLEVKQEEKTQKITAKNIIIATGARPKFLKGLSPEDSKMIMGYKQALMPEKMPKNLLVIGSGAIGVEFASFYNSLGAKVTIVEVSDRIMIHEDKEVSEFVKKSFEKQGIRVLTSAVIKNFTIRQNDIEFEIKSGEKINKEAFDSVISAVGVCANIEEIGLENTNVKISEQKYIMTNSFLETNEKGVYAIGDVVSPPWLAHKASREGMICAEVIAGETSEPINPLNIPGCTYCHPQVASVGLTQEKAEAQYGKDKIRVGNFPLFANGKALALGDGAGFIKTIFHEKTGELLGAHMVGPEVTEMIFGLVLAKQLESTELDLMRTIFPHPTISEAIHESVLSAFSKGVHI